MDIKVVSTFCNFENAEPRSLKCQESKTKQQNIGYHLVGPPQVTISLFLVTVHPSWFQYTNYFFKLRMEEECLFFLQGKSNAHWVSLGLGIIYNAMGYPAWSVVFLEFKGALDILPSRDTIAQFVPTITAFVICHHPLWWFILCVHLTGQGIPRYLVKHFSGCVCVGVFGWD